MTNRNIFAEAKYCNPFLLSCRTYCAGVPGLEPRLTEPESAGLPITPYPTIAIVCSGEVYPTKKGTFPVRESWLLEL